MAKSKIQLKQEANTKIRDNGGTNPIKTKGGDLRSFVLDFIDASMQIDDFNALFAGELAGKKQINIQNILNLLDNNGKILANLLPSNTGGVGGSFAPQTYTFVNQNTISITHTLGRKPITEIITDLGESVLFDKTNITNTDITINFLFNISGTLTYY